MRGCRFHSQQAVEKALKAVLVYRQVLYREGQDQREMAVLDKVYHPVPEFAERWGNGRGLMTDRSLDGAVARADFRDAYQRVQRGMAVQSMAREAAVARENSVTQEFNQRVCWLLSTATEVTLPASPEKWWQWWKDYNEVALSGEKPIQTQYHGDQRVVYGLTTPMSRHSCLVAGTAVWTDRGATPIEQIKVGDRVLSQNPATGELAYKPVLQTTRREPVDLITFQTGDESIQCSGGHLFWVAGEGWVKARDLKPGTRLHGVTGTAPVNSVAEEGHQKVYNLVVADSHTYFVGNAKVLSHDITIRRPTSAIVPGLTSR